MQILHLYLNMPLHPGNIPAFRGAIVELLGRELEIFHNHQQDPAAWPLNYQYPLVQYQVRRGRACICGINAGAEAIKRELLPRLGSSLFFAGEMHAIQGYQVQEREASLQLSEKPTQFALKGWKALSSENYARWKSLPPGEPRERILTEALTGHLRRLAEDLGTPWKSLVEGQVVQVDGQKRVSWHGTHFITFDAVVQSNLLLPMGIGLGRTAAFGYGEVLSEKAYQQQKQFKQRGLQVG
jgi:Cas6b C-terminal domain/Cas6b N-terminal domain